ncbi:hypothetical protein AAZX31_19G203700 [Glycine max]|uniref:ATP-dependent Clp protease proteolytic subunit 5, chloroplastic isoform A n=1 Tax=Glycine soja TaxID=3848 RepID=A0A445FJU8_GLYSO|nr:hypothetical protein JHK84_054211 [Glycine max]KAG5086948.1 hypothetical protein JHK82_054345 [Glycine max]RZB49106.1 ATP-dependent Clp protease proteolytic subunit 5, chloroplastic isoform A [Glycine soja]RZB49107.1 ATP-dependent Clp protease proteolytic subunit 5, chloroplastic isoform B [Glycine soja]
MLMNFGRLRGVHVREFGLSGHGPPPMVQERFQSVISQLFQYRIVRCGGAVDDDMSNIIVAQLLYLDAIDPNKDIVMYVNSLGGSVAAVWVPFCLAQGLKEIDIACQIQG